MESSKQNILDVAEAFRLASRARAEEELPRLRSRLPEGSEAAAYLQRIELLGENPREATDLSGLECRPFFVLNTLLLATGHALRERMFICGVIATGLEAFVDHFDYIGDVGRGASAEEGAVLDTLQRRYFAYCIAQLTELGMGLEGVLQTMKGDASDQGTAYQVRACLEGGPEALLASDLFTPEEKRLWKAYFDEQEGAWEAMQKHLIETYQLPFRAAPPPPAN